VEHPNTSIEAAEDGSAAPVTHLLPIRHSAVTMNAEGLAPSGCALEAHELTSMTASNQQGHWRAVAGVEPEIQGSGASLSFDFAQARREKLPGPGHYLMQVRRRQAERAKHSWACRSIAN